MVARGCWEWWIERREFLRQETILYDTIIVDVFVKVHKMYNITSEPRGKLQILGYLDVLV